MDDLRTVGREKLSSPVSQLCVLQQVFCHPKRKLPYKKEQDSKEVKGSRLDDVSAPDARMIATSHTSNFDAGLKKS